MTIKENTDQAILDDTDGNVVLFYPNMPKKAIDNVTRTLQTRWIGQGPQVDEFELKFSKQFSKSTYGLATGSGTDALHVAYILAGLKPGDSVIVPLFTCTATNLPFIYMGVNIIFADVQQDTMNICPKDVASKMNDSVKAIVCVHYGGLPCDMDELIEIGDKWGIPVIQDGAHAIGAEYKGQLISDLTPMTMFSFQAIKHITTGDGGMLLLKDKTLLEKGKRVRWFGIDRNAKQGGIWENDITEIGYKYQMTDIAATIGLAALEEFSDVLKYRQRLFELYNSKLNSNTDVKVVGSGLTDRVHACWLMTILVKDRKNLQKKLLQNNIDSNQVHFRNDRYTVFKEFWEGKIFPNMDAIEDDYLVLPLHTKVREDHVLKICEIINEGW